MQTKTVMLVMNKDIPIITIDGPSGSGKGTVAGLLAQKLQWNLLDSGAIYRLHAYKSLELNIAFDDVNGLVKVANALDIKFQRSEKDNSILAYLDNHEITAKIRTEKVGSAASKISIYQEVRDALLKKQHSFVVSPGLVADGRDMGSVVFPHASLKVYLDASCSVRAKRRQKQLQVAGVDVKFPDLLEEVIARDHRDKTRKVSPLVVPKGAVVINTDDLNADQVFERLMILIQRQFSRYWNRIGGF